MLHAFYLERRKHTFFFFFSPPIKMMRKGAFTLTECKGIRLWFLEAASLGAKSGFAQSLCSSTI